MKTQVGIMDTGHLVFCMLTEFSLCWYWLHFKREVYQGREWEILRKILKNMSFWWWRVGGKAAEKMKKKFLYISLMILWSFMLVQCRFALREQSPLGFYTERLKSETPAIELNVWYSNTLLFHENCPVGIITVLYIFYLIVWRRCVGERNS